MKDDLKNEEFAIEAENVTYRAKDKVLIDSVDLQVRKGETFGLLGLNGSGKSLLIDIITDIIYPESGKVSLFGTSFKNVKGKVGVLYDNVSFIPFLKVGEFLNYVRLTLKVEKKRLEKIRENLNLSKIEDKMVRVLSQGEKKRMGLAMALMNDPDLLIMDEPTTALDPFMRDLVWDLNKNKSKTVFLTSHSWDEAEKHCDSIAFIHNGKILGQIKSPSELLADELLPGKQKLKINKDESVLKFLNGSSYYYEENDAYHVFSHKIEEIISDLNSITSGYSVLPKSLKDIYFFLSISDTSKN
ncbi:MAG: ABC transporter ATP-binding protein [Bacteroidota bacterium]